MYILINFYSKLAIMILIHPLICFKDTLVTLETIEKMLHEKALVHGG